MGVLRYASQPGASAARAVAHRRVRSHGAQLGLVRARGLQRLLEGECAGCGGQANSAERSVAMIKA